MASMSARELKAELAKLGVDTTGCLDKADLVDRLARAQAGTGPPPPSSAEKQPPKAANPSTSSSSSSSSTSSTSAKVQIRRILKTKDYYEILCVERTANEAEIKRAYRKLAVNLHPDKCSEPNAEEAFKKICGAYDTLKTQSKRDHYDRFGSDSDNLARGPGGMHEFSPEDIFREVFGAGGGFGGENVFMRAPGGGATYTFNFGGPQPRQRRAANAGSQQAFPMRLLFVMFLPILLLLLPLLSSVLPYLMLLFLVNYLQGR